MVSNAVPDYLPTSINYQHIRQYNADIKPYYRYNLFYLQKMQKVHFHWHIIGHGKEIITLNSSRDQMKTVPFAKYAHTRVVLNHHVVNPRINQVGAMLLPLKAGQNRFSLQYQPSQWFRIGMLISIGFWILLLLYGLCRMMHLFYIKCGPSIPW
ncbi:hypothetical protein [Acetilactobacillus jinshanensis]|uniref:Uncharacterized protein n=1 Tax=Acetilactobacillus jinshanensis TaxID=1720083 RepID=A0A4P6ZIX7_9LACO|nr:hypothetical protein [Acetilactobacillus jinshanensis]QBP17665.1 hypothetical protein ELX58_00365 [Acetilactobacillus jinshanensis]URL61792.1 hypothetical protein HGK75_07590 [uncultured bacterium]